MPFGQLSAVPNGNCRPGVSKGKECFEFWGHPHPSQVIGTTEKKCKDPFTLMALDQAFLGLSLSQGSFDPYIVKT